MEKQVESYWIKKYDSGIIHLCFNTVDKWINYHRYNDQEYHFGDQGELPGEYFTLNEKLPLDSNQMYACTELQNKDQICFYYIPFNLIR
jgi:hypothetical protein